MLEKLFKLKEKGTTVWIEFIAGLSTFMAMSYIIFVNPNILSSTGMDYGAVYTATILSSVIATLITGLYANVPYAQSTGLGLNALFTYTLCGSLGFTWQQSLAMVCICGIINIFITVTSVRKKVLKAMPTFMQEAITVGIGLFITYIGVKNAGLIEFAVSKVTDGVANASDVVPQIATFNNASVILSLIGLFITSILVSKKNKGAYILGIIITTLIGIPMGVTKLPDYYGFVKGLVDSQDLSLNISREMLQHDRQLKVMAKNIENKIKAELEKMLNENREEYEKFFAIYGTQLKFGTYADYGMNKDKLKDLLLFKSSKEEKLVTLKEYVERAKEGQDTIYYASGETVDKIKGLPQVESVSDKGYEILYLTENVDEFVLQILVEYEGKKFKNVCADNIDMGTEEEKAALKKINDENKEMLDTMKEALKGDVQDIKFTDRLTKHPVCLTTEGGLSIEMAKTINNQMGANEAVKAQTVLEINKDHVIVSKLKELFNSDKEELKKFTKILYSQARLIEGLTIENPTEYSNWICELLAK